MAEPTLEHESSAIALRPVLAVGAILAVTVIVLVIVVGTGLGPWVAPRHAQIVARSAAIPPAPRLQPHPDHDFAVLRAQKQELLSSWAWTDPAHDFARISIERAMALYAQQHATTKQAGATLPPPQESAR